MEFDLVYDLEESGWAKMHILGVMTGVSYLHDSLKELAEAAIRLEDGAEQARVIFMNEPGELQLILRRAGSDLSYEGRWFDKWNSWGLIPDDRYRVVFSGTTTVTHFALVVLGQLRALLSKHGIEGYKALWLEHGFPIEEFKQLQEEETEAGVVADGPVCHGLCGAQPAPSRPAAKRYVERVLKQE